MSQNEDYEKFEIDYRNCNNDSGKLEKYYSDRDSYKNAWKYIIIGSILGGLWAVSYFIH
jgi:hypothetical protein